MSNIKVKWVWRNTGKDCDPAMDEAEIKVLEKYGFVTFVHEVYCPHGIQDGQPCWKCDRLRDWREGKLQILNRFGIWEDAHQADGYPVFALASSNYRRRPEPTTKLVEWPVVDKDGLLICKTHYGRDIGRASKAECQAGFRGWKHEGFGQPSAQFWIYVGTKFVHATSALMEVEE